MVDEDFSLDAVKVQKLSNVGEVVVGGVKAADPTRQLQFVFLTTLANMNNPEVNEALLAYGIKFSDIFTKTKIFPRDGMVLPNGAVYQEPKAQKLETK